MHFAFAPANEKLLSLALNAAGEYSSTVGGNVAAEEREGGGRSAV